jgi:hypothetical protein
LVDDSQPITVWLPVAIAQPAEKEARARGLTAEQFLIELIEKSLWLRGWKLTRGGARRAPSLYSETLNALYLLAQERLQLLKTVQG